MGNIAVRFKEALVNACLLLDNLLQIDYFKIL
jgi:hypothetical protein